MTLRGRSSSKIVLTQGSTKASEGSDSSRSGSSRSSTCSNYGYSNYRYSNYETTPGHQRLPPAPAIGLAGIQHRRRASFDGHEVQPNGNMEFDRDSKHKAKEHKHRSASRDQKIVITDLQGQLAEVEKQKDQLITQCRNLREFMKQAIEDAKAWEKEFIKGKQVLEEELDNYEDYHTRSKRQDEEIREQEAIAYLKSSIPKERLSSRVQRLFSSFATRTFKPENQYDSAPSLYLVLSFTDSLSVSIQALLHSISNISGALETYHEVVLTSSTVPPGHSKSRARKSIADQLINRYLLENKHEDDEKIYEPDLGKPYPTHRFKASSKTTGSRPAECPISVTAFGQLASSFLRVISSYVVPNKCGVLRTRLHGR
jgi:hypothetical protein